MDSVVLLSIPYEVTFERIWKYEVSMSMVSTQYIMFDVIGPMVIVLPNGPLVPVRV